MFQIPSKIFRCPICLETPDSKVFQCKNGHIICAGCISRVQKCPQCAVPFPPTPNRNLLAEAALDCVDLPCPFETNGCGLSMKREKLATHRTLCNYRSVKFCANLGFKNCEFETSTGDALRQHMDSVHSKITLNLYDYWIFSDIFNSSVWEGYPLSNTFYLMDKDKETFVVNSKVSKPGPNGQVSFSCATFYLGDEPKNVFDYWITIRTYLGSDDEHQTTKAVRTWGGYPTYFKNVDDPKSVQWFEIPIRDVNQLKLRLNPELGSKWDLYFSFIIDQDSDFEF